MQVVSDPEHAQAISLGADHTVRPNPNPNPNPSPNPNPNQVFDIERGTCKRTCLGHRKGVLSVAAVDSLALLVSGGLDRDLLVWPYVGAGGGRALASLRGHESPVVQVASD